ncbi:hypothetical protein Nepgr_031782 [Nepenthes gracilis]|uniref:Uncharacterized protein n=1 Tax=Nepenthes gracilis TaxID=150966 RepID=A0AAD3Y7D7_NEPGR|nr:hypothetical protein Nepgr_031782 [Nepenthes gracilis]
MTQTLVVWRPENANATLAPSVRSDKKFAFYIFAKTYTNTATTSTPRSRMVNTRAQASAPARELALHHDGPDPCVGIENHPDPAVKALAARIEGMSKAFEMLCSKIDERMRGAPSRASQAGTSQGRNKERDRREKPPSRRENPRTQVASNSGAPRGLEGCLSPRVREESPERRNSGT